MNIFWTAALILILVSDLRAQLGNQGSISGVIKDPSGAVVPAAMIQVSNLATSISFKTTSNDSGLFDFSVLPLGRYELSAEKNGFAMLILKNILVTEGAKIDLSLELHLVEVSNSVEIIEQVPLLETSRSHLGVTVDSKMVQSLPINGRSFMDLVLLSPGVTRDVRGGFSFAGQQEMNSLLVDGADNNGYYWSETFGTDGFSAGGMGPYQFSQEAVQEFKVNSNAYSAEFGRAGGGIISMVTRSGTNQMHGSAFWYYRDKAMNANDAVNKSNGEPKSAFHFNQFGETLGGPIKKNRLFFFQNYEGQRSAVPNTVLLTLPDHFQLSQDPSIAGYQTQALDYLKARAYSWVRNLDQNVFLAKLDWQISPTHLLYTRWNSQRWTGPTPQSGGLQNSFENGGTAQLNTDVLSVSLNSNLTPVMTNIARFGYAHGWGPWLTESANPQAQVYEGGGPVLTVGRTLANPQEQTDRLFQGGDTLNYFHGHHGLKVGADVVLDRIQYYTAGNFAGSYRFNSLESFGRSLAGSPHPIVGDFYRQIFSGFATPGLTVNPNSSLVAFFIQDEWKVRSNLSLNLGLRYDLQLLSSPTVKNPSPSLEEAGLDTSYLHEDKNNIGPRFGFAWTPFSTERMVVRGGYGLYYAVVPAVVDSRAQFQNGITAQTNTFFGGKPSAILIPAYPNNYCGHPDPSGVPPHCAPPPTGVGIPIIMLFSKDYVQPYVQQASLGLEFQFEKNWVFSVSYLAAKGTHLLRTRDINLSIPTTLSTISIAGTSETLTYEKFTLPRPIFGFNRILQFESNGNSIYNGLILFARKRFSNNYQLMGSYTFGKVIDDNPNAYYVNPGGGDFQQVSDPPNIRNDRAVGNNDQRHRLIISGLWDLNYFKAGSGFSKALLNGWELSGIFTAQSGQPYSGLVSFDLNNDGNPDTDRTPSLGRNTFYMPASVSLDPRLTRNFHFGENRQLQFIVEAFNVFNHTNINTVQNIQYAYSAGFSNCGASISPCLVPQYSGLSAFGTPTSSTGARILQLAFRYSF